MDIIDGMWMCVLIHMATTRNVDHFLFSLYTIFASSLGIYAPEAKFQDITGANTIWSAIEYDFET